MIKLEYDVKTAGVRISFVLCDSEECDNGCITFAEIGESKDGVCKAPQTVENLNIVARMLNKARRQVDKVTVHVPEGAVEEYARRVTAIRRKAEVEDA